MKKVLSLLCVLALAISASAAPIKRVATLGSVTPNQKAVMVDNQVTSPVSFTAVRLDQNNSTAGVFKIYFYDANDKPIARADIKTGSDTKLAGVYSIETTSIIAYGGHYYSVTGGNLSMISRGTSAATGEDIYDVVASGWELTLQGQTSTFGFSGQVAGIAAWEGFLASCNNGNTDDCNKARITLTETPVSAIELFGTITDNNIEPVTIENYPFWSLFAYGYPSDSERVYYLDVTFSGNANNIIGSYTKADLALNNGKFAATLLYAEDGIFDDENNIKEIELSDFYGTVTKETNATNVYRLDFYAVANNTIYHFVLYKGVTITETSNYDVDEDFHASFALTEVTPFSKENGTLDTYNGLTYFIVDAKNATQSTQLLFFTNHVDETIGIPAGRYTVSSNEAVGVMQAGEILEEDGQRYPNPSFAYDTKNGNNYYRFITSGTADVQNANGALYILVKGMNTFYRTVEITVGVPPITGIDEVKMDEVQDGQKMMIDGQLYIKRGDNLYNAQGKVVK